ncbi:MAG: hypothetical protein K6G30_13665 [Acetatifactor sp.]|nr:hypothetical protein [Acetatifactor sp.]
MKKLLYIWHSKRIFWSILFILGMCTILPYGAHLDQQSEQDILFSNVIAYCEKTGVMLPFSNQLRAEGISSIAESIEIDHGMSVFYPMVWIYALNAKTPYIANIVWHIYIFCFSMIGIICFYKVIESIFSSGTAKLATLFFFFTPRIFAEMHYNNKDIVLMALACMVYYSGWKLEKETTLRNAVIFGILGAFITNMKIVGVFIWGVLGLWILLEKILKKQFNVKLLNMMLACIGSMAIFFILLTPATWNGLRDYILYVLENAKNFRWNDYILFNGKMYCKTTTGIPRKYLPVIFLMTTPVGVILLASLGTIFLLGQICKLNIDMKIRYIIAVIACGIVPFGYAIVSAATVYNGWRHFYFIYPSVIILVALALSYFEEKNIRVVNWSITAYLIILFAEVIAGHPKQYAYYNEVARFHLENKFEIDYWDMSFKQLLEYLTEYDTRAAFKIAAIDNPSKWGIDAQLLAIRGKKRCRIEVVNDWESADYVILNATYAAMYCPNEYQLIQSQNELVTKVNAYGNDLSYVYKVEQ